MAPKITTARRRMIMVIAALALVALAVPALAAARTHLIDSREAAASTALAHVGRQLCDGTADAWTPPYGDAAATVSCELGQLSARDQTYVFLNEAGFTLDVENVPVDDIWTIAGTKDSARITVTGSTMATPDLSGPPEPGSNTTHTTITLQSHLQPGLFG